MALSKVRANKASVSQSSKEKPIESAFRHLDLQLATEEPDKPSGSMKTSHG